MELLFKVASGILTREDSEKIVGRNISKARFSFDDTWDGYTKVAVFSHGTSGYPIMLDDDGTCTIPNEITNHSGYCRVEIDGSNGTGSLATNFVTLYIYPNMQSGSELEEDSQKNLLQQVLDEIANFQTHAVDESVIKSSVKEYLDNHSINTDVDPDQIASIVNSYFIAHKSELKGQNGRDGFDGRDGKDGKTPVKGVDYWTSTDIDNITTAATQLIKEYIEAHSDEFRGPAGQNGIDGVGTNGKDGHTPVRGTDYFTDEDIESFASQLSTMVAAYMSDHATEFRGEKGDSGISINSITFTENDELLVTLSNGKDFKSKPLRGSDGTSIKGDKGEPGQDGKTPQRGIDYYTEEDVAAINAQISTLISEYFAQHQEISTGEGSSYTPIKGTDYWTESDIQEIVQDLSTIVSNYFTEHKEEFKGDPGNDGVGIKNAYRSDSTRVVIIEFTDGRKKVSVPYGVDGDSAYDIAVKNGFKGSEAAFLESLKGENGTLEGADAETLTAAVTDYLELHPELLTGETPQRVIDSAISSMTIVPNVLYVFTQPITELEITWDAADNSNLVSDYHFSFHVLDNIDEAMLILPEGVRTGDFSLTANSVYEVSIVNNNMSYQRWDLETE